MTSQAEPRHCLGRFSHTRSERWTGGRQIDVLTCTECHAETRINSGDQGAVYRVNATTHRYVRDNSYAYEVTS